MQATKNPCPVCEGPVDYDPSLKHQRRYCSDECKRIGQRNVAYDLSWGNKPGDPSPRKRRINEERARLRKIELEELLKEEKRKRLERKAVDPSTQR